MTGVPIEDSDKNYEARIAALETKLEHIRSLADVWDESKDKTRMQCAREIWAITEGE